MAQQRIHRIVAGMLAACATCAAFAVAAGEFAPGGMTRSEKPGLAGIHRERLEGYTTASGELYNRNTLTAAHRSLAFGTVVRVTNLRNHRTVIVRINDRSPVAGGRVIELTPRAAGAIGLQGISTAEVKLEVLGQTSGRTAPREAPDAPDAAVK